MSFPTIYVYGKPACQQCEATKRQLDAAGVPYTYLDVTEQEYAAKTVQGLGYKQLPVVQVGDIHWSQFRHAKLKKLIALYRNGVEDISLLEPAAEAALAE